VISPVWDGIGSRQAALVLVLVWSTDTAAFLFGKLLGGPKLAPKISPKKTWAGSLCGLIAAAAAGGLLASWASLGIWQGLWLGICCGIFTQAGDLLASLYKRRMNRKDFGSLLPGHGGLLDRIDGLLLASPAAYFFLHFFVWG
jgi:phosphatidate cytidylyltransferase